MAENLAAVLKPPFFVTKQKGDPEQLLQDWKLYIEGFKDYLLVTKAAGEHSADHTNCAACKASQAMLRMVGGENMKSLMEHVGKVVVGDTFEQVIKKVEDGIMKQTNQSVARHKLFMSMGQEDRSFAEWYPLVKEQAARCDFSNYSKEMATRDALLFQTTNDKLKQKILSEDMDLDKTIKIGLALEQSKKKVDEMNSKRPERKEVDRVAKLEEKIRALETKGPKVKKKCEKCEFAAHTSGKCPAENNEWFQCHKTGHFARSSLCKKKRQENRSGGSGRKETKAKSGNKSRKVSESEGESETDSERSNRVKEGVRALDASKVDSVVLKVQAMDHGSASRSADLKLVVDTGVNRTLIAEEMWLQLKPGKGLRKPKLKKARKRFIPYGTNQRLVCLGRSKVSLEVEAGARITTIAYVMRGTDSESLLGRVDAKKLGVVSIDLKGAGEVVRSVEERHQQQEQGDPQRMQVLVEEYPQLFQGIGKAVGVEPIHVYVDESVTPIQQKRRPIPIHYVERFKDLLEELKDKGVVTGPLSQENSLGWIHNPVIVDKKSGNEIRLNLDTKPMAKAVTTSHYPIPTPQELRHSFVGSDTFSALDMRHSFFQFKMDEETKRHYVFWTPWGLYRFETLAMGVSSASAETHERIRRMLARLEGVAQIKDDIVVHGCGEEHDGRLKEVFKRLAKHGLTLNRQGHLETGGLHEQGEDCSRTKLRKGGR